MTHTWPRFGYVVLEQRKRGHLSITRFDIGRSPIQLHPPLASDHIELALRNRAPETPTITARVSNGGKTTVTASDFEDPDHDNLVASHWLCNKANGETFAERILYRENFYNGTNTNRSRSPQEFSFKSYSGVTCQVRYRDSMLAWSSWGSR